MKCIVPIALFIVGSLALPQQGVVTNERVISDTIIIAIENVVQDIKDAGLDPLNLSNEEVSYALPVPIIFNAAAAVEVLLSTGLSNIIVNNMRFSLFTSRLTFDIELPHIHLSAENAGALAIIFGKSIYVEGSGSIDVRRIRAAGSCTVNVGLITGIFIRGVDMNFTVNNVESNVSLKLQDRDYSAPLNHFIGNTIPHYLTSYKAEIDLLMEILLVDIINKNLNA